MGYGETSLPAFAYYDRQLVVVENVAAIRRRGLDRVLGDLAKERYRPSGRACGQVTLAQPTDVSGYLSLGITGSEASAHCCPRP